MESDAPPNNSIPNPVDTGPSAGEDDVRTEGGFKAAEEAQDEGDEEAPPEDHVVQLRCVLEIINTGKRRAPGCRCNRRFTELRLPITRPTSTPGGRCVSWSVMYTSCHNRRTCLMSLMVCVHAMLC